MNDRWYLVLSGSIRRLLIEYYRLTVNICAALDVKKNDSGMFLSTLILASDRKTNKQKK